LRPNGSATTLAPSTPLGFIDVLKQHAFGSGIAFLWEQQLLNTPVQGSAS
jgi:hypothetical protein